MASIFSGKHLRSFTVIAVVAGGLRKEPLLVAVIVFVDEIYLEPSHLLPVVGKQMSVGIVGRGTCRSYYLYLGMLPTHGLYKGLQPFGILLSPLFVADAKILQAERIGVSHLGAQVSPCGGDVAVGKLYQVEGILNILVKTVEGYTGILVLILADQADVENRKRFGTDIFRQEEQFVESESVSLIVVGEHTVGEGVVPAVLVQRSVLSRSHRVFPLIARRQLRSLHNATAGKTEHARMQFFEQLHQVGAQPMPVVGRKERHMVEVDSITLRMEDAQEGLFVCFLGCQRKLIALPVVTSYMQFLLVDDSVVMTHQFDAQHSATAGIYGEVVLHPLPQSDAEESVIVQPGPLLLVPSIAQADVMRIAGECRPVVTQLDIAKRLPAHEGLRKLERAVLHHFGIETSVGSKVDILEEDAPHGGLDGCPQVACVHLYHALGMQVGYHQEQCHQARTDAVIHAVYG